MLSLSTQIYFYILANFITSENFFFSFFMMLYNV